MRVLVITPLAPTTRAALQALPGLVLDYLPDAARSSTLAALPEAHVLVLRSQVHVDAALLKAAPRLGSVLRLGVGTDHIDLPALEARNIALHTTQGANAPAVGEHTLGLLLGLLNNIAKADREIRRGRWLREPNRGHELAGRTVGLVGYGNTGQAFARVLRGFACTVVAYDKYRPPQPGDVARAVPLPELQAQAEVLSFHVPLTEETHPYYDADFCAAMQRPHWLLNTSRGPVVALAAALEGLASGHIRGAAIDVLENEQLDTLNDRQRKELKALLARENVVLTPHIAGWSHESRAREEAQLLDVITRGLPG